MKVRSLSLGFLACFLLVISFSAQANTLHDPVGTYEFTVTDIPEQADVTGTMVVSKEEGAVKVKFTAATSGETYLQNAKLDGHNLTGEINVQGIVLKLSGKFSGDKFTGNFMTEYGSMGITAEKK